MRNDGIIIYATEEAKKKYEDKMNKKIRKEYCPSCEIKKRKNTFIKERIEESVLSDNNN